MVIKTAKDLGQAIKDGEDYVEIEGDLKNKVLKIKATGKVAWAVAFGALSIAITSIIVKGTSAGTAAPVTTFTLIGSAPAAVGILGAKTTFTAIMIAVAGGSVSILNKLRGYNLEVVGEKAILTKK